MLEFQKETTAGPLRGRFAPDFEPVAEAFAKNFEESGEVGASVCVTVDGDTVVDLWGGSKEVEEEVPWEEDTMCVVFSSTKGAVALAAHTLIAAGELDVDALVSRYWPEFAVTARKRPRCA